MIKENESKAKIITPAEEQPKEVIDSVKKANREKERMDNNSGNNKLDKEKQTEPLTESPEELTSKEIFEKANKKSFKDKEEEIIEAEFTEIVNLCDKAREKFIKAEKAFEKYKALTGDISKIFKKGEKVQVKEEYENAKQEYEQARAEHVTEHLDKFINERMELADSRAEKFEKGKWKKVWDWAGKELSVYNFLEKKFDWKVENKLGRFLAKGFNARTIVSLGLLGTGIGFGIGSAVGISALVGRRVYAGLATGMGSYELLRMFGEKYPHLTEKKLESMDYNDAEGMMAKYEIRAKLKGEKISENKNYQKLKDKYLELLIGEKDKANKKADVLIKAADKQLEIAAKGAKRNANIRKVFAVSAGIFIGSVGLNKLAEHFSGGSPEQAEEIVNKVVEEHKIGIAGVGEEAEVIGAEDKIAVTGKEIIEKTTEKLPDKFELTVQANEGYIHEARKALTMYIHEAGKSELGDLTKAQKIWAEDRLWDLYREAHPDAVNKVLHVGDKVEFGRGQIEQVLNEVQDKFGAPEKAANLSENLKGYVDNVKWDRYDAIPYSDGDDVYGWELDEGVKAVDLKTEVEALTKTEIPEEVIAKNHLESFKMLSDNVVNNKVSEMYNLSSEEYKVIKDMPINRFVDEYSYWFPPKDMIYGEQDHLELWHKLKLKDAIINLLSTKNPTRTGMSIHEYLKECWSAGKV
ncbi:MAG: hypothetical protein HQ537_02030 [Parcubacteria group bacterium]|nr:hypothetical protein [Parcubacteria group bacterium]